MPSPCLLPALDPAQLTRARLRIAWQMLAQVGEHLDLVPVAARVHVADALSELALAKAVVEETTTATAKERLMHHPEPTGGHR
jgi:hypothetical protein